MATTFDRRDCRSVRDDPDGSTTVATSNGCTGDANRKNDTGESERPGGTGANLQNGRSEQKDGGANFSGRRGNELRKMAAAGAFNGGNATAGGGSEGYPRGAGVGVQHGECIHCDVPKGAGDDAGENLRDCAAGGARKEDLTQSTRRKRRLSQKRNESNFCRLFL